MLEIFAVWIDFTHARSYQWVPKFDKLQFKMCTSFGFYFIIATLMMMMMIAPNSRARKGGKKRGEVKGEYGRI